MSSIEKSSNPNLEDVDYGDIELNKLFKSLDIETQNQIRKYPNKQIQIEILKKITDPL